MSLLAYDVIAFWASAPLNELSRLPTITNTLMPNITTILRFMRQGFTVAEFLKPRRGSRIADFVANGGARAFSDTHRWVT
jgi:hypothetical protein